MRQLVYILFVIGISVGFARVADGQEKFGSVVMKPNWRQYSLNSKSLAVSFPKLPNVNRGNDYCSSTHQFTYAAYAEDVVYSAIVTAKGKGKPDRNVCPIVINFGPELLEAKIGEITGKGDYSRSDQTDKAGRKFVHLSNETSRIMIVEDFENQRFVELRITASKGRVIDEKVFFDSLSFAPNKSALDPKDGAVSTIGDDDDRPYDPSLWNDIKPQDLNHPLRIVHKFSPRYTNKARWAQTEGTVVLRVTFLRTGSIGDVSIVSGLPNGLTETAISAARRILFLPRKDKGGGINISRQVEYSFTIY